MQHEADAMAAALGAAGHAASRRHAWVIRNARLGAASSMTAYGGQNDGLRLQAQAGRDGIRFNLAYSDDDVPRYRERPFDRTWTDSQPFVTRNATQPAPRPRPRTAAAAMWP